jgi:hemolysin D
MIFKKKDIKNEFLPSALEIIETPGSPLGNLVIYLIFSIIVIVIVWSVVGVVDEVALARGKVIPDGNIKVIQSLEGGVITEILVNEGQSVKKGQLLIRLDGAINNAELEKIESSLEIAKLERDLLCAIRDGDDSKINSILKGSSSKFFSKEELGRQRSYKELKERDFLGKQRIYDSEIKKSVEEYKMVVEELTQYNTKVDILQDELVKNKKLLEKGVISEKEYLDIENQLSLANDSKEIQLSKISFYEQYIGLNENKKELGSLDYDLEILKEIVEKDKYIQGLEKEKIKIQKRIELQNIVSPVDGTVQGVGSNTIGGVVNPGKAIITIVPANTPLYIEAKALNKDIGFLKEGQEAEIKLDTFPYAKYGTIKGTIEYISPDAVEDEKSGYIYKVLVKPETEYIIVDKKNVKIAPGMTVLAEMKTGKRKIIEIFLPASDYIKDSMKLR